MLKFDAGLLVCVCVGGGGTPVNIFKAWSFSAYVRVMRKRRTHREARSADTDTWWEIRVLFLATGADGS